MCLCGQYMPGDYTGLVLTEITMRNTHILEVQGQSRFKKNQKMTSLAQDH
jgi:hypothetical protein